jgi:RNase H-fold protein (predicted Holliday junction resolvase)
MGSVLVCDLQVMKMPYRLVDGAAQMVQLAQQHNCDSFVVGVPVTRTGSLQDSETDSQSGRRCRNFAHTLAMVAKPHGLPVFVVDERYTTMDALLSMSKTKRGTKYQKVCYCCADLTETQSVCRPEAVCQRSGSTEFETACGLEFCCAG